ncbi:DNA polymerase alpha/epsilon subunit B-domain-containing protein [Peziza echinospora]|nr:DNA polymerase alpha/epsilon subunit B-domain-containing protein [Peziza echinospora]
MTSKGKGKQRADDTTAPIFRRQLPVQPPSSAFLTSDPFDQLPQSSAAPRPRPQTSAGAVAPAPRILAVEISPSALRPLAFRVFTKKHNLTLKSDALALLCQFIGRRCGSEWRDSGAGEKLLDEIARTWKRNEGPGGILVDGGDSLKTILKGLEVPHQQGKGVGASLLGRQASFDINKGLPEMGEGEDVMMGEGADNQRGTATQDLPTKDGLDPRKYLKVVDAFKQPKYIYNMQKKQFERAPKPSLLPPPQSKTQLFKQRYHLLHQRLLRNESFLPPSYSVAAKSRTSSSTPATHYTITPIANLLGRSNQSFLLFGLLTIAASGQLTLTDPTGTITLDLAYATPVPLDGAYFTPGCFLVVDGTYDEGTQKFTVLTIGQPPCERRDASAEIFGHVDFLATGSVLDPASAQNRAMRRIETALDDVKMLILSEVELDVDTTFTALRAIFETYVDAPPLVCILMGNFIKIPFGGSVVGHKSGIGGGVQGTLAYKEYFNTLASLLGEFPTLIKATTFVFVPGDNDPFTASFSGGRSVLLPREPVPEVFVNRVKRVLATGGAPGGNPETRGGIWTSNPCRLSYFSQEMLVIRDDAGGRLGRNAVRFRKHGEGDEDGDGDDDEGMDIDHAPPPAEVPSDPASKDAENPSSSASSDIPTSVLLARKLVKTLLDQGHLSPYPLNVRPLLWDFSHTMSIYPLPTSIVIADATTPPFAVTYEGCHVMNPGRLVERRTARWVEFKPAEGRGTVKEVGI